MPAEIIIEDSILAVAATYQNVFGRAPNSQESAAWAEQIGNSGATAAQLATVLADSPEGAARVSSLYQQVLGRSSSGISSGEIASGQAYLAENKTNGLAGLRASMASSAEAQADIKAVYQNVLGRAASRGEISTAENALVNGATLANLYSSAGASPELKANLAAAYTRAFGTAPSAAVAIFLQQQIVSGAGFLQLATALTSLAGSSGGTGTPVTPQITGATQDPAGAGYVDISGTGQPGASISTSVTGILFGLPHSTFYPFAAATVGANGTWSVTNAPDSGAPGAGQAFPDTPYIVTPIETASGQTITGTPISLTVSSSGVTFNPAESMVVSASTSGAAPAPATTSTVAGTASLAHLANPATVAITPVLHS